MTGLSDLAPRLGTNDDEVVGGGGKANDRNLSKSKKSKKAKSGIQTRLGTTGKPTFLTLDARKAFNQLRQAFTKAPILQHFDPECHIRIETNASGYAIGGVLSQLTSDLVTLDSESNLTKKSDFGQWHPEAYFSRKMFPAETWYKTHNAELLAIIEAFKTSRHYLEGCKHEVLVLTNHNNLWWFIDTKSLSSKQVYWAQELSRYHFRINYCQGKANGTADALSRFPQRSQDEEEKLWAKNTRIFYCLQSLLTNASLSGLNISAELLPLYQVLICGTSILSQVWQFWTDIEFKLVDKHPYRASIGGIRLRLAELQESDKEVWRIRTEGLNGYKKLNGVLYH